MAESNPRNKIYIVEKINSNEPAIEVKADRVIDNGGRIQFFDGDDLVASFVNINFSRKA